MAAKTAAPAYTVSQKFLDQVAAAHDWANYDIPTNNLPKDNVWSLFNNTLPNIFVQSSQGSIYVEKYAPMNFSAPVQEAAPLTDTTYYIPWSEVSANKFQTGPLNMVCLCSCNGRKSKGKCVNVAQLAQAIAAAPSIDALNDVFAQFFEWGPEWSNSWISRMASYNPQFDAAKYAASIHSILSAIYNC